MDTGALVREARRRAGLTQAELARRAGTSQPAVAAYETGRRSPATSTLVRLLAASGHRLEVELVAIDVAADLSGPVGRRLRTSLPAVRRVLDAHGARRLRVIGSVARGQDHEHSDLDLVVEVPTGFSLLDHVRLTAQLEDILGIDVDVLTGGALTGRFGAEATRESVPL